MTSSERAAFEAVFRAHYDGLVRFANRLVRSHAEAEELVHDVLLKVWMRRAHLAPTEELKTYLFRSTYNHALNHLRRRKVERLWKRSLGPDEPIARPTSSDDDIDKWKQRCVAPSTICRPAARRSFFSAGKTAFRITPSHRRSASPSKRSKRRWDARSRHSVPRSSRSAVDPRCGGAIRR